MLLKLRYNTLIHIFVLAGAALLEICKIFFFTFIQFYLFIFTPKLVPVLCPFQDCFTHMSRAGRGDNGVPR